MAPPGGAPNLPERARGIKEKLDLSRWTDRVSAWAPPAEWRTVLAIDAHTAGEPLRVILGGFPESSASTMLERRREARSRHDDLRRSLMWEPRGHADMYGCIVGPPVTPEADIGVLFTHNDGFSTMCGHGIIGVTTVLIECGLVPSVEPRTRIAIDTPAGFVEAHADVVGGSVRDVSFVNVPSFAAGLDLHVDVPGLGEVGYDLGYGGAFYAYVDAADFGLTLRPDEAPRLIDLGRRIKDEVQRAAPPAHPADPDLGFVYGTIFVGPAHEEGHHSRNVCVFADGEIDRSPTGTGVSGRLALHHRRGELEAGTSITIESILGTTFSGRVLSETTVSSHAAVVPEVRGRAFVTGRNELWIDPDDPLATGFLIR